MKWRAIRNNIWFRVLTNKYLIITVFFVVWILWLDSNAWLTSHRELDKEIAEKEESIDFYQKGIARDSTMISKLNTQEGLERYARERYHFKKPDENVYLIEFQDSLKKDNP